MLELSSGSLAHGGHRHAGPAPNNSAPQVSQPHKTWTTSVALLRRVRRFLASNPHAVQASKQASKRASAKDLCSASVETTKLLGRGSAARPESLK